MSFNNFKSRWKQFFDDKKAIYVIILTVIILIAILNLFGRFLLYIEKRPGVAIHDPLFAYFTAVDFNTPIFILIYGSLLTGLLSLIPHPKHLVIALQTYSLMVVFRFIAMYLTPLEVPEGIINLRDPFVFTLGTGQMVTKDLFFSGHLASLTILFFTAKNKYLKWMYFSFGIIVAVMIFFQKAHYTIDMIAAPFFAYTSFMIAKKINEKILKKTGKQISGE